MVTQNIYLVKSPKQIGLQSVELKIRFSTSFRLRMAISLILIRLAAFVGGFSTNIAKDSDPKNGEKT